MLRPSHRWLLTAAPLLLMLTTSGFAFARGVRPTKQEPDRLLVLAASSLADVIDEVVVEWVRIGGMPVQVSVAATSRLASQALETGDVLVAADHEWMDWLLERGGLIPGSRRDVAANRLVLVRQRDAPLTGPRGLSMIDSPQLERLALAGENVPAGRYAEGALRRAGLWASVENRIVRGGSVRGTLEWVARGEVDAGIVYRTDALAEPRVTVIVEIEADQPPEVRYPAAALAISGNPEEAADFVRFLVGPAAQEIFRAAAFLPPSQATGRAPLGDLEVESPRRRSLSIWSPILLSLGVALLAVILGLPPALGVGWLLARREFMGKGVVATLAMAPLVLPPVVTGFLLLTLFGSRGLLGSTLQVVGISIPFTMAGAVLAALVVGLPLYVVAIRGAFEAVDPHYEEVSWTLGVSPARTFGRVTLPLAFPGIAAGAVLAFARALGEFGATVVLAGNIEGRTQTIALAVYTLLESPSGGRATWVLVGASVALSLAALVAFERLTTRQRRRMENRSRG